MDHSVPTRIAIIADSLGLPRPSRGERDRGGVRFDETYPFLLQERLRADAHFSRSELLVNARRDRLMRQVPGELNEAKWNGADAVVIHIGVCDAAPRVLSPLMHSALSRIRPVTARDWVVRQISVNRRRLIALKGPSVYTSPKRFTNEVRAVGKILVEARLRLGCFVNIAPPDPELEERSPGYEENVGRYNQILAEEARGFSLPVIDLHGAIGSTAAMRDQSVDGQHLNARGNALLAELIHRALARVARE